MVSILNIGEYVLLHYEQKSVIHIVKRTKFYITLHIELYHGYSYTLEDVYVRKKIFIDVNNDEYIKPIYYTWNTIFIPSENYNELRYDSLSIKPKYLIKTR